MIYKLFTDIYWLVKFLFFFGRERNQKQLLVLSFPHIITVTLLTNWPLICLHPIFPLYRIKYLPCDRILLCLLPTSRSHDIYLMAPISQINSYWLCSSNQPRTQTQGFSRPLPASPKPLLMMNQPFNYKGTLNSRESSACWYSVLWRW